MSALLRLKPYLRPHAGLLIGSGLLAIPLAALRTAPVAMVQYVVDDLLKNPNSSRLLLFPAGVIAIYLLNFVVRFFHYYLLRKVIGAVNTKLKNDLYDHLLGLSADYFTAQSTGTLISRVGTDVNYVDAGVNCINVVIREPLTFLFLFGYALHANWRLTLITLLVFPPLAWVFSTTGRNLKRYIRRISDENARIYSTLQESFTGIRVVKAFQLEGYLQEKFRERTDAFNRWYMKTAVLEEASHPMVELLTAFVIAGVIYFGGREVIAGRMQPGQLFGFFASFALMMNPIRSLNEVNIKLNQAAGACERIFQIFDWKPNLHEAPHPAKIRSLERGISLRNVEFAYPDAPERKVLRGVSFDVAKGSVVALAGASGAGKSSLVSLLPRIFDVSGGSIEIDGRDIREYRLEDLRRLIAVVSQDVFLFNDTISENIRCGRLGATDAEIREAARRAHALDFIEAAPEGFASIIGDRGQKLSGGERQRISIARAFLREAPILILDEATSSLDATSERAVQSALEELMKDRTTIVIAHRLSTIREADRILVLREGQVIEQGRHDELLQLGGEYARFHSA